MPCEMQQGILDFVKMRQPLLRHKNIQFHAVFFCGLTSLLPILQNSKTISVALLNPSLPRTHANPGNSPPPPVLCETRRKLPLIAALLAGKEAEKNPRPSLISLSTPLLLFSSVPDNWRVFCTLSHLKTGLERKGGGGREREERWRRRDSR